MSRRENAHLRCDRCRLHKLLCVCALLPSLETRARVIVVMHADEADKPTNTGALAALCLVNAVVIAPRSRGRDPRAPFAPDEPSRAPEPLAALEVSTTALLFPSDDATPVDASVRTLVVPDGTWRQARKIAHTLPFRRVTLANAHTTQYLLRAERRPSGLSTLEAIAYALDEIEPAPVSPALLRAQRIFVERTLWMRGRLRDDEVTGGIPPAARHIRG